MFCEINPDEVWIESDTEVHTNASEAIGTVYVLLFCVKSMDEAINQTVLVHILTVKPAFDLPNSVHSSLW